MKSLILAGLCFCLGGTVYASDGPTFRIVACHGNEQILILSNLNENLTTKQFDLLNQFLLQHQDATLFIQTAVDGKIVDAREIFLDTAFTLQVLPAPGLPEPDENFLVTAQRSDSAWKLPTLEL